MITYIIVNANVARCFDLKMIINILHCVSDIIEGFGYNDIIYVWRIVSNCLTFPD